MASRLLQTDRQEVVTMLSWQREEMVIREIPGWPPRWSGVYGGQLGQLVGFPQGEVGTLRAAAADTDQQAVVLAIELDGDYATGLFPLPGRFVDPVAQLLRTCSGMPVRTIGSLGLRT